MPALTFQLPVPEAALSPNARDHWSRKMVAVKAARTAARREAERVIDEAKTGQPRWKKARYLAVLYHVGARVPDPDNFIASLKPYLDGLADAGVIVNDRELWPLRPAFRATDRMPRVEIKVEPEN